MINNYQIFTLYGIFYRYLDVNNVSTYLFQRCYFPPSCAVAKSMADLININQNDNKTCYRNKYEDSGLFDSKIGKRLN